MMKLKLLVLKKQRKLLLLELKCSVSNWIMLKQEIMLVYYYVVLLVKKLKEDKFLLNLEQLLHIINLKLQFMY